MNEPHTHDDHGHAGGHAEGHDPNLAHHFESMEQQFESGKLGMWVFLATEILMFGGLFCAYAIYRGNHPEVFLFAHKALNTSLGAINTAVLLASSFTMAWAVYAIARSQTKLALLLLALTFVGGVGFMGIKTKEYHDKYDHSLWIGGLNAFYQKDGVFENPSHERHAADFIEERAGHHIEHQGAGHGDAHAAGAGAGAAAADHGSELAAGPPAAAAWPPKPADAASVHPAVNAPTVLTANFTQSAPELSAVDSLYKGKSQVQVVEGHSHYPRLNELNPLDKDRTHIFFQIYFLMTGLHGFHVVIGMAIIAWVAWRTAPTAWRPFVIAALPLTLAGYFGFFYWLTGMTLQWPLVLAIVALLLAVAIAIRGLIGLKREGHRDGDFGPDYYGPVEITGLYWHLVDLIWIFLFPLMYLIH